VLSVFNLIIFGLLFGTGYVLTGELALPIGLHFACRQTGVTSRGLLDYMIAAVAIRRDLPPLAWDADMVRLADVTGLRLDSATAKD
jgi:predicted nucleic acid-binding protein